MESTLRTLGAFACVLAIATISASCSKPADPVTTPSSSTAPKTPFPGGVPLTSSDLTATPAVLPPAPPAYDSSISREEYARFAWRQFIYLNSAAQPNGVTTPGKTPVVRGAIDPRRNFAASGDKNFYQNGKSASKPSNFGSNALVWETFAHRSELFPAVYPANLAPQGDLRSLDPQYIYNNPVSNPLIVEPSMARFNNLDESTQIAQNQIFFPKTGNMPSANPYDDDIILFQAKVNQVEYDYIKSICNPCNSKQLPSSIELPPNTTNPLESIEVKSAWRQMSVDQIESGRYHTAEALYYRKGKDGKVSPQNGIFGLVGLHILRKMQNYPTFVYTTFEHVDNLQKDSTDTGLYLITLYDRMNYDPSITAPTAIVNTGTGHVQVALPLEGPVTADNRYPFIPGSFTVPPGFAGPIKVGVSHAGTLAVNRVNVEVSTVMAHTPAFNNSVWQYYRLAGIQIIPMNEDSSITDSPNPLTEDFFLANNVIESSQPGIQLFKGGVKDPNTPALPGKTGTAKDQFVDLRGKANILKVRGLPDNDLVMGGCMGCHGNAQYPRDPNTGDGPSIFNFLITADTLSGKGFSAEAQNESPEELRAQALKYMR
jgi:hypothetical protein